MKADKSPEPLPSASGSGYTAPASLPEDVRQKILNARDALTHMSGEEQISEAYHALYSIADPSFESYEPWARIDGRYNEKLNDSRRTA